MKFWRIIRKIRIKLVSWLWLLLSLSGWHGMASAATDNQQVAPITQATPVTQVAPITTVIPTMAVIPLDNPWEQVVSPTPSPVRIIGRYSNGCIQGAVSLLPDEGTFTLMRPSRRRYFAHPHLRELVLWLSEAVHQRGLGKLLVGDLGLARGGPTSTGHASHQIGLDADFWLWLGASALSAEDKENLDAPSMLDVTETTLDLTKFTEAQVQVLKLAATHPKVERIFINPHIKKYLCEVTKAAEWLRKLRPWRGHHYHFHVRLGCPAGQPWCESQEPPPLTAGCDAELMEWLQKLTEDNEDAEQLTPQQQLAAKLAQLPKDCARVLDAK